MSDPAPVVVYTDVDGCIVDASTYRVGRARATIARLRHMGVRVVLCTSKTRSEVVALFGDLGHRLIAIVESGAAVLVPPGTLSVVPAGARRVRGGRLLALGAPYADVRAALAELRRELGGGIRGFGDMTASEVSALTGLTPPAARRAKRREFDEPFIHDGDGERLERALRAVMPARGLRWTRGSRFWHLHGDIDKGQAVRLVKSWLSEPGQVLRTIGLGDSPHDLAMLVEVDEPAIIPRPDGTPDPTLRTAFPRALVAPRPGPEGWAVVIDALIP